MVNLFDQTISTLERALDFSTAKNRTIGNNIANIDTPNYKAQDVIFKNVLNNAMDNSSAAKRTHPKHLSFNNLNEPFRKTTKQNTFYNHNGNNVDIDKEMAELATNQIYYQSMIDRLNNKFNNIQTVIRGGN